MRLLLFTCLLLTLPAVAAHGTQYGAHVPPGDGCEVTANGQCVFDADDPDGNDPVAVLLRTFPAPPPFCPPIGPLCWDHDTFHDEMDGLATAYEYLRDELTH